MIGSRQLDLGLKYLKEKVKDGMQVRVINKFVFVSDVFNHSYITYKQGFNRAQDQDQH